MCGHWFIDYFLFSLSKKQLIPQHLHQPHLHQPPQQLIPQLAHGQVSSTKIQHNFQPWWHCCFHFITYMTELFYYKVS